MGWQDDNVVSKPPAWSQDEVVSQKPTETVDSRTELQKWGQAIKNVAQGGAHLGTGFVGSVAGDVAGLASLIAPPAMIARKLGYEGGVLDPTNVRNKVADALTYTPDNQDTLSMKVATAVPRALDWAGSKLEQAGEGVPGVQMLPLRNLPVAAANAIGLKGARIANIPEVAAKISEAVPATSELRSASNAFYKASEDAGVVIKPESTQKAASMIQEVADKERLGRLPPDLKEAKSILDDRIANNQPLTLRDADKVREMIGDAQKSTNASDRRLAGIVKKNYDAYLDGLTADDTLAGNSEQGVALLKDARELYRRTKNSEMVDTMERKAKKIGETNYSQAGEQLALQRQFLNLSNKIDDKKAIGYTASQRAAIDKVAAPGVWAGTLRNVGKFDPLKGGVPATMATLVGGSIGSAGGPLGSILGAASLGTIAHLANKGAQAITRNNVAAAREALVGRGLPKQISASTGVRPTATILSDLQSLEAQTKALPATEPFDSARRMALANEKARLQAELSLAVAKSSSQR